MALTLLKDESELQSYATSFPTSSIIVKGNFYAGLDPTQQYKNVLTGANKDHLIVYNNSWANLSDIDIELLYDQPIDGLGGLINQSVSGGGGFRIARNGNGDLSLNILDSTGAMFHNVVYAGLRTTQNVSFVNLQLIVDGNVIDTLLDTLLNITTANNDFTIGVLAGSTNWPLTGTIFSFRIGAENFLLNESSGASFTGDLGSTGTRFTSSLDPDYINDVMIQPYNP